MIEKHVDTEHRGVFCFRKEEDGLNFLLNLS